MIATLETVGTDHPLTKEWHSEARDIIRQNFQQIHNAFLVATDKAVWLGLFLNYVKERGKADKSIPHGEFQPWLKRELPEIAVRTAQYYMDIGRGVAEKGGFQIRNLCAFADEANLSCLQILSGDHLPPGLAAIRKTVSEIIEGKTQTQLMLEFKTLDADGNPRGAGRPVGSGVRPQPASLGEQAALLREQATKDANAIVVRLDNYGARFTALDDGICAVFESHLDRTLKAVRAWLKQPKHQRDPQAIEALLK